MQFLSSVNFLFNSGVCQEMPSWIHVKDNVDFQLEFFSNGFTPTIKD